MDEDTYIPKRLNDAMKLYWFDLDAVVGFSFCFICGVLANKMAIGGVVGFIVGYAIQKLKAGKHMGYTQHLIYWYLPPNISALKATPPSYIKELIG